jgi:capsular exopolysaccharide synthesis family protein
MWFRSRNRLVPEAATKAEALLENSAPFGVDLQSSSPANDLPCRETQSAPLDAPDMPASLRSLNRQATKFEPEWSQIARDHVINPKTTDGAASFYNVLGLRLLKHLQRSSWSTVIVTSPTRESGNTITALNLAISIAEGSNVSVLLVELDLVRPSLARILRYDKVTGVTDYLLHDAKLSDIVLNIGIDGLGIIPAGSPVANSSEMLSSRKMARLVEELRALNEQTIVLFDLPSVLAFDDAVAFSPLVDCALLVVEEGTTRVTDVRRASALLEPTKIVGVVLNRSTQGD